MEGEASTFRNAEKLIGDIEDVIYGRFCSNVEGKVEVVSHRLTELVSDLLEKSWNQNEDAAALQLFEKHDILNQLFTWIVENKDLMKAMTSELLKIFENILSIGSDNFIRKRAFVEPLMLLLLALQPNEKKRVPPDLEMKYVQLLSNLCIRLADEQFLEQFSQSGLSKQGYKIPKYSFINILMSYIHENNEIGDYARDSLIVCLQISASNEKLGKYIAYESDCCNILAAGLSGLYSALPTTLNVTNDDWFCINKDMIQDSPDLQSFVKAVKFCCEVIHFGCSDIGDRLLDFIHSGFLNSVLAAALHQTITEAIIAAIAYLELFIREITQESFVKVVLKFLLADEHDGVLIIDMMVDRIKSRVPQLNMVTLQFFKTLMDLNCEDVIYHLIIRYLIPCAHILPNQKRIIKELDFYCKSATMFLYLTPSCCVESQLAPEHADPQRAEHNEQLLANHEENKGLSKSVRLLLQSSFIEYLHNARVKVRECKSACRCWCAVYDGMDVLTDLPRKNGSTMLIGESKTDRSNSSVFSFAARRNSSFSDSDPEQVTQGKRKLNVSSESAGAVLNGYRHFDKDQTRSKFFLGPFMAYLYEAIEGMMENSYYVNLHLTSLVSRIACYPQPILRSLLLNSNLVMQPGLKSLFQILTTLSQTTDIFVSQIDDFKTLLIRARQNLTKREKKFVCVSPEGQRKDSIASSLSVDSDSCHSDEQSVDYSIKTLNPVHTVKQNNQQAFAAKQDSLYDEAALARTTSGARIGRLHPAIRSPQKRITESIARTDRTYLRKKDPTAIKNAIYCAVMLEEWLKELAAISLEHNVI